MSKHARDLLHHAEARGDSELKEIAQRAFEISSRMLGVKDRGLYSDIRDLEHHAEDLMTALRSKRKALTKGDCPECGTMRKAMEKTKALNRNATQELISVSKHGGNLIMSKELVMSALAGSALGKGVSVVTPMVIPGATMGIANKTLANVAIGGVLTGLTLYGKVPSKYEMAVVVAGTSLIATELIDLLMGYVVPSAAMPSPAPAAAAAMRMGGAQLYATSYGAPGASAQYSNGSLIIVD